MNNEEIASRFNYLKEYMDSFIDFSQAVSKKENRRITAYEVESCSPKFSLRISKKSSLDDLPLFKNREPNLIELNFTYVNNNSNEPFQIHLNISETEFPVPFTDYTKTFIKTIQDTLSVFELMVAGKNLWEDNILKSPLHSSIIELRLDEYGATVFVNLLEGAFLVKLDSFKSIRNINVEDLKGCKSLDEMFCYIRNLWDV